MIPGDIEFGSANMIDRGQIELAQIVDRLMKSHQRSKRQYLIERIGHIWSAGYTNSRIGGVAIQHHHTVPTPESISAVQSFERDTLLAVRIAVTFALRQKSVPDQDASPTLIRMLADSHPFVRINAANSLSPSARQSLNPEVLNAALNDNAWTVRWIIAQSLAVTPYSEQGWTTLRATIPADGKNLSNWLNYCLPYYDRFAADHSLVTKIRSRLQSQPEVAWRMMSPEWNRLVATSEKT